MIGDISFFSLIDKIKLKFNPLMAKYDLKLSSMDAEAYINVLELFYTLGEELSRFQSFSKTERHVILLLVDVNSCYSSFGII